MGIFDQQGGGQWPGFFPGIGNMMRGNNFFGQPYRKPRPGGIGYENGPQNSATPQPQWPGLLPGIFGGADLSPGYESMGEGLQRLNSLRGLTMTQTPTPAPNVATGLMPRVTDKGPMFPGSRYASRVPVPSVNLARRAAINDFAGPLVNGVRRWDPRQMPVYR